MQDAFLANIAREVGNGVTVAQVALRYQLQRGVAVVTSARSSAHQAETLGVLSFELSRQHVALIDGLTWLIQSPLYVANHDTESNVVRESKTKRDRRKKKEIEKRKKSCLHGFVFNQIAFI